MTTLQFSDQGIPDANYEIILDTGRGPTTLRLLPSAPVLSVSVPQKTAYTVHLYHVADETRALVDEAKGDTETYGTIHIGLGPKGDQPCGLQPPTKRAGQPSRSQVWISGSSVGSVTVADTIVGNVVIGGGRVRISGAGHRR